MKLLGNVHIVMHPSFDHETCHVYLAINISCRPSYNRRRSSENRYFIVFAHLCSHSQSRMQKIFLVSALLARAFAMPKSLLPDPSMDSELEKMIVSILPNPDEKLIHPQLLYTRQERLCVLPYCQVLYNECVTSCASLSNGQW